MAYLLGERTSKQNLLSMSSQGLTEHSRRSSTTTVRESWRGGAQTICQPLVLVYLLLPSPFLLVTIRIKLASGCTSSYLCLRIAISSFALNNRNSTWATIWQKQIRRHTCGEGGGYLTKHIGIYCYIDRVLLQGEWSKRLEIDRESARG